MKRNVTSRSRSGIAGPVLSAVMAAALVSWALPAWGVEKETCQVTQIQLGPSTYGEVIYRDGRTHDKGHSAQSLWLSDDPRFNGYQTFLAALYLDEEWNVIMHGTWVLEVGTWTGVAEYLADPENAPWPVFTPTAAPGREPSRCEATSLAW